MNSQMDSGNCLFAKQYNQVKWTLPESIEMSQVNAVTFQVADQKVPISLKVYNGGDDATAANTQYGLSGQTEYTINPSGMALLMQSES